MSLEETIRLILTERKSAAMNLAIDKALVKVMERKLAGGEKVDPIFRTYKLSNPAVIIGYRQKINGRFDETLAKKKGVDVTMRDTGGGHMYFSEEDIHFSFIAPRELFDSDIVKNYQRVNSLIVDALRKGGFDVKLGRTSIRTYDDKLIAGTAQWYAQNTLLHQGCILVNNYNSEIFRLLMAREDEIKKWNTMVTSLKENGDNYFNVESLILSSLNSSYRMDLTEEEKNYAKDFYLNFYINKERIMSGTKEGDICLIAGENSTKNKEQEVYI